MFTHYEQYSLLFNNFICFASCLKFTFDAQFWMAQKNGTQSLFKIPVLLQFKMFYFSMIVKSNFQPYSSLKKKTGVQETIIIIINSENFA